MATRTPATLRDGIPLPFDCTPFRGPKLTKNGKPFAPKPFEPGTAVDVDHKGETVTAQVWSPGPYPNSRWVVADGVAFLINTKTGHVWETCDYRRPAAEVAA